MIAVVVRQDDQIYRWQVGDLASWLDLAPGPYAMTQIDVLAFVEEGGIGQDRQSAKTDQCGGITDEVKIALIEFCRPTRWPAPRKSSCLLLWVVIPYRRYALLRYGLGMSQFQSGSDRADRLGAFGMTTKAKNAAFKSW